MWFKECFQSERNSVSSDIFEREDIEIISAVDDGSAAKAIDWGLEKVKAKGAKEKQLLSGFFSILLVFDYSIKGKLFEILEEALSYNVIERRLCTTSENGESTSASGSAGKTKSNSFFRRLFSKRCEEATSKHVDIGLQNKTTIGLGLRVTSLQGMNARESEETSLPRNKALESIAMTKRDDKNVAMCLAQLLFVPFEMSSDDIDAFWELVSECLGKDEKFDLLDQDNRKTLRRAMRQCGSLKSIRRILYRLLDSLSKEANMLGETLREARKCIRDDPLWSNSYLLEI